MQIIVKIKILLNVYGAFLSTIGCGIVWMKFGKRGWICRRGIQR
jgi:hypothetical protein